MDSARLPRKLAAILYADVAGYSRLTGEDEDATHRRVSEYLDIFSDAVIRHHGRVMHYAGDAVLAMFEAVVDALACAAFVQAELETRNREVPERERVLFRVGVNLGDVIEDRGDIYGDGVNVAARLESLAEPGGICVSESVHTAVGDRLPLDYDFLGEQEVKNIARPVRAYRARLRPGEALPPPPEPRSTSSTSRRRVIFTVSVATTALVMAIAILGLGFMQPWRADAPESATHAPSGQTSIAVLPFSNLSGDAEQEYFSDGIAEDIITDLSQLSGLAVIARQSSFAYRGRAVKAQDIGKELGVRYLLEGSVRKSGDRVRITAQLVETENGHQLWAARYDRELGDIFALQDDIKRQIVNALSLQLTKQEDRNFARVNTSNFEAYDAFLQGRRNFSRQSVEGFQQAIEDYRRAISLDPDFARAYGALATTYVRLAFSGGAESAVESRERGIALARKAVEMDPDSAQTQWALGFANLHLARFDEARAAARRAIELSPSYADAYLLLALINNYLGRGAEALAWAEKAWELNPHATWDYPYNVGRAHYNMGEYEKAVVALEDAVERNEENYIPRLWLAASYVRLSRQDDAEWEVDQIEMVAPDLTFDDLFRGLEVDDGGARARLFEDLRAAGFVD